MRKKFYNSTEWGIQESNLDKIRSNGFDYLKSIGCKTNKYYSLSIEQAIKDPDRLDEILNGNLPFLVLLEPNDKKLEKKGKFNVKSKNELYLMIKELDPKLWNSYSISLIEQIQENGHQFVGVAMSDGKGKLFIEFLEGTTNSKFLTSTGADPLRIDSCSFSDFETISEMPKKIPIELVDKIKDSCHFFKGYYEFVYGRSQNVDDVFFTFYSDIDSYINILNSIGNGITSDEISNRLKYTYLKNSRYIGYEQKTEEDKEER